MTSERVKGLLSALTEEIDVLHDESMSCAEEKEALQLEVQDLKALLELSRRERTALQAKANELMHPDPESESWTSEYTLTETGQNSNVLTSNAEGQDEKPAFTRRPSITEFYIKRNMYRQRSNQMVFRPEIEEKASKSLLVRMVRHPLFDTVVGVLIIINTMCMAGEMQYQGMTIGYSMRFQGCNEPPNEDWTNARIVFEVLDNTFVVIFALELAFRFVAFRLRVFREPLNYIDIVAVGAGFLHWIIKTEHTMLLRMLRVAKLVARSLRLLKLTKWVESLHILVKSISASISTLFWSVVLLVMFQFVAGMMLSQLVQPLIMDETKSVDERHKIFIYYGTFSRSQITMFEIHLANFGPACRILVDYCGEWYAFVFLAYRCLAGFAVLNVINAVFIQQTISLASRDSEIMFINRHKEVSHYARDLKRLFQELDMDGDGTISLNEWHTVKSNPDFIHIMNTLELNAADTSSLFQLMDLDGDGTITCEELIESALRLRGNARSVDVLAILANLHKVRTSITEQQCKYPSSQPSTTRTPTRSSLTSAGDLGDTWL